jgi:hypothetical protein
MFRFEVYKISLGKALIKGGWFTKPNKLFVGTQKEVVKS